MRKINLTRVVVFSLHSWLGLITGVFLLLLGLSGSGLVFLKEIDQAINSKLLTVTPAAQPLPLDRFYQTITIRHPNLMGISWLNPDAKPHEAYEFRLYQNDGKLSTYDLGMMSINPYTGEVLRDGNLKDFNPSFMYWLLQFHWSFQMGIPGLLLATVFGITMLFSILTGLIVYRKYIWKVFTFKVRMKWKNWRIISSDLHRIVGVWALGINAILFFTGFWMNMFALDPAYWKRQSKPAPMQTLVQQPLANLLQKALEMMPELVPENVYLPTQEGKNFKVSGPLKDQYAIFNSGNSIEIDPNSSEVIAIERFIEKGFWSKVACTIFPLHAGTFGGITIKVLYVIFGLLPGLLSITGFLLWWRKIKFKG